MYLLLILRLYFLFIVSCGGEPKKLKPISSDKTVNSKNITLNKDQTPSNKHEADGDEQNELDDKNDDEQNENNTDQTLKQEDYELTDNSQTAQDKIINSLNKNSNIKICGKDIEIKKDKLNYINIKDNKIILKHNNQPIFNCSRINLIYDVYSTLSTENMHIDIYFKNNSMFLYKNTQNLLKLLKIYKTEIYNIKSINCNKKKCDLTIENNNKIEIILNKQIVNQIDDNLTEKGWWTNNFSYLKSYFFDNNLENSDLLDTLTLECNAIITLHEGESNNIKKDQNTIYIYKKNQKDNKNFKKNIRNICKNFKNINKFDIDLDSDLKNILAISYKLPEFYGQNIKEILYNSKKRVIITYDNSKIVLTEYLDYALKEDIFNKTFSGNSNIEYRKKLLEYFLIYIGENKINLYCKYLDCDLLNSYNVLIYEMSIDNRFLFDFENLAYHYTDDILENLIPKDFYEYMKNVFLYDADIDTDYNWFKDINDKLTSIKNLIKNENINITCDKNKCDLKKPGFWGPKIGSFLISDPDSIYELQKKYIEKNHLKPINNMNKQEHQKFILKDLPIPLKDVLSDKMFDKNLDENFYNKIKGKEFKYFCELNGTLKKFQRQIEDIINQNQRNIINFKNLDIVHEDKKCFDFSFNPLKVKIKDEYIYFENNQFSANEIKILIKKN